MEILRNIGVVYGFVLHSLNHCPSVNNCQVMTAQDFLPPVAIHPLNMEIVHDITVPLPESVWKHLLTR